MEVAVAGEVDEAGERMTRCSAGTFSEAVEGVWDLIMSMSWVASNMRSYIGIWGTSVSSHKAVMRHGKGSEVFSWFSRMPISGNMIFPTSILKPDMIEAIRIAFPILMSVSFLLGCKREHIKLS